MKSFAVTDIGQKRTVNQDYVFCSEEPVGKLSNLFVVADGMGGHNAGDTASRLCVGSVRESISNSELATPVSILNEAVAFAHDRVRTEAAAKPEFEGMGTTLVIATIQDNKLYVANVGDSRLYLLRDSLEQITEDHSLVEEMVKSGELSKENVKEHPNKNIITRALGIGETVMADTFEVELKEDDIILMCSNGLTNMVDDIDIEYIIKNNRTNMADAGEELLARANDAGGKDNITVLLACL